jgi:heme-degrading monooxygenase HmoA
MSHVIIWEFVVREGCERVFEKAYGPEGAWAALFGESAEHLGTELLRDATNPRRYVTIDRWRSAESFARFRDERGTEYEALDAQCEGWTEQETKIGRWTVTA